MTTRPSPLASASMSVLMGALISILAMSACANKQPAPTAKVEAETAPATAHTVQVVDVVVVAAEIAGRMPNGAEWDQDRGGQRAQPPPAYSRYLRQHPELTGFTSAVGVPFDDADLIERAQDSLAADPVVFIEIGDRVFRSPIVSRTFAPAWNFSFRFLYQPKDGQDDESSPARNGADAVIDQVLDRAVPADGLMHIHVLDYDGPGAFDPVGMTILSARQLVGQPLHQLGAFASVAKLTLQVQVRDIVLDRDFLGQNLGNRTEPIRLHIPGTVPWTDTGIDLVAGQRVTLRAADQVCTTDSDEDDCSGPEGQTATRWYNQRSFEHIGHGGLIATLGDTRFVVGRTLQMIAPASGRLRLGVNDRDTDNNRGAYAVHVVIEPLP